LRQSGLIEKRIFESTAADWLEAHAVACGPGRTRAPEGIPALAEALRDHDLECGWPHCEA